jgi:hypothetical protein
MIVGVINWDPFHVIGNCILICFWSGITRTMIRFELELNLSKLYYGTWLKSSVLSTKMSIVMTIFGAVEQYKISLLFKMD